MIRLEFDTFVIEIQKEHTYSFGSTDNTFQYAKEFFPTSNDRRYKNAIGLKCLVGDDFIDSAIIAGFDGYAVHAENVILDNNRVVIVCNNIIACFSIPEITMLWSTEADWATCFEIYKIDAGYIIRGETAISKIDFEGNIQWQFHGCDIFVSPAGKDELILKKDYIQVTDWNGVEYHLDYNGKCIFDTITNKKK